MWDLIVSVPHHCLSFYFFLRNTRNHLEISTIFVSAERSPCLEYGKKKFGLHVFLRLETYLYTADASYSVFYKILQLISM